MVRVFSENVQNKKEEEDIVCEVSLHWANICSQEALRAILTTRKTFALRHFFSVPPSGVHCTLSILVRITEILDSTFIFF